MREFIKWVFDGIGAQLICLIIGGLLGGFAGFGIGRHKEKMKQHQEAGSRSEQFQKGTQGQSENYEIKKQNLEQVQKAGDQSKQIQIGEQEDVK